jgi:hypothetical protein
LPIALPRFPAPYEGEELGRGSGRNYSGFITPTPALPLLRGEGITRKPKFINSDEIVREEPIPERPTKKPLPDAERKRRAMHDLISPGITGWELAPASRLAETGCCGVVGPYPSATLDKILTKLSEEDFKQDGPERQYFFSKFSRKHNVVIG